MVVSRAFLETLIIESNYCFVNHCTIAGEEYLGRIVDQLPQLSQDDRELLEHKYEKFFKQYIKPQGVNMCYEIEEE